MMRGVGVGVEIPQQSELNMGFACTQWGLPQVIDNLRYSDFHHIFRNTGTHKRAVV